ncbi:uncharacterized protein LOC142632695 [Castanea sativa]|uniref:uncharacterized protein LOC142632695 n=1 Tax=Castanea sativa TaxID=21020 RepID=UPI003F64AA9E
MRAFLCSIDESVWDSIENGYVRPTTARSECDKAVLALANANSKAINAIFCGVSTDEFHKISHAKTAKGAWMILETTYEGTKKVKDTNFQMLTTQFEELKMSDDKSFDSFYGKLNEIKKTKIEIKIQELIGSFQTYELGLPSHKPSKSLALKTINERLDDSSEEDDVEKEVAFLAKNFRKFLKMKSSGKSFSKGKFSSSKGGKKEFKKKDGKDSQSPQGVVCFECNGHGHIKKECPNYLRGKGKVFATTLSDFSDSESSNSNTEEECDSDRNYRTFMTITFIESKDDLRNLVNELGEHFKGKEVEESEDEDICQNVRESNLQEAYDSLLEDCGKYAKVANHAVRKMKKIEEEHKCTRVQLKEAKCEVEALKGELVEAYSKINVLLSQKSSHDKTGLGYTGEESSSSESKKEVRFVLAKSVENLKEVMPETETPAAEKRTIGDRRDTVAHVLAPHARNLNDDLDEGFSSTNFGNLGS